MSVLPDGAYDAFVVDATEDPAHDAMRLDLTIIAGEHKGEMVTLTAKGLVGTDVDLLGMPATLTVTDGEPHVDIDG
jgi:hypothetical protein